MLLLNILLALAWLALTGQFTPTNLVIGLGLGYVLLWLTRQTTQRPSNYFNKVQQVVGFILFFLWELILANLRVMYDILTPRHHMRPGVVAIPLDIESNAAITLLANLITLTPGSLSLDVSSDRRTLYVHAMHIDNVEQFRREIKEGFEQRVQEVMS